MSKCGSFRKDAKHRITIQSKTLTGTDYGGSDVTWSDVSTVWAIIKPMSGREVLAQEMLQSRVTSKMIIRYQSALKNTKTVGSYRVNFDGRIFPIVYVRNLDDDMKNEGKAYQEFYTQENGAEND